MKGVFLDTDSIAPEDLDLTQLNGALDNWTFYPSTLPEQCLNRIKDAEVVVTNKVLINSDLIQASSNLKLIQLAATGTNNVDLSAAKKAGVTVSNVKGYGPKTVAQHTFSLILALSNNLHNYVQDVKQNRWAQNHFFCLLNHPITELAGKNLVIIGYGQIGQAVAKIAAAFDMKVFVANSYQSDASPIPSSDNEGATRQPLSELLPIADVLTLHCPLTSQTQNIISAKELSLMKKSALLINVARGGLVDETALAEALVNHQIAGAGIDVLTEEPPTKGNPLLDPLPNLVVTPHCAWGSREARQRLVDTMAINITSFFRGEPLNLN